MAGVSWREWTLSDVARHNATRRPPGGHQDATGTPPEPHRVSTRPTKYRARSVIWEGQRFDSQKEFQCWRELKAREAAGEITKLERQVPYKLHAYCPRNGEILGQEVGEYRADFRYIDRKDGQQYILDAKGYRNALFLWKARHFQLEYGLRLDLV